MAFIKIGYFLSDLLQFFGHFYTKISTDLITLVFHSINTNGKIEKNTFTKLHDRFRYSKLSQKQDLFLIIVKLMDDRKILFSFYSFSPRWPSLLPHSAWLHLHKLLVNSSLWPLFPSSSCFRKLAIVIPFSVPLKC